MRVNRTEKQADTPETYLAVGDMLKDAPFLHIIDRSVGDMILEYLQSKGQIQHEDVFKKNWHLEH